MAKTNVGHLDPFDETKEEFYLYAERMEHYFEANAIEETRKVATFLALIGPKAYKLLRNMLRPKLPKSETLSVLIQKLMDYYRPAPIIIAERFRFYKRNQQQGESIAEFLVELNSLASSCEFGEFLSEALRDRLVCGIRCDATQRRLLTKKNLQLQEAIEIATAMELAEIDTVELKNTATVANVSARYRPKPQRKDKSADSQSNPSTSYADNGNTKRCYRCGAKHDHSTCKFKDAKCYTCKKKGHIAPACRSGMQAKQKGTVSMVAAPDSDSYSDDEELQLNTVRAKRNKINSFNMNVQIHGKKLNMILDTAADVSTVDEEWVRKHIPFVKIYSTQVRLQDYNKGEVSVMGKMHVPINYESQTIEHDIYIVGKGKPCLFGKDMIDSFKINWDAVMGKTILALGKKPQSEIPDILLKYQEVFENNNKPIKHFKADIKLINECQPMFKKSRNVPYALKSMVEEEIKKAEQRGIWTMVQHSKWATPVVVVPKKTGAVRLCGDFRTTVNQNVDINQYPLPTQQDLFTALNGGKYFTKLDLSNAYQQVQLNQRSKELLTLNTHLGLLRPNRLLYGISSASAIFQSIMDNILQGLKHVVCYQDDILVIGTSMSEHNDSLLATMDRLKRYNVKLNKKKCIFAQKSLEYLGHVIDENGIHPTEEKVSAIKSMPRPETVSQLRTFLGILNYYIKFVRNASTLLAPLHNLLKKETKWNWSAECEESFQKCKAVLTSQEVLVHYDPGKSLKLACDASPVGVGAIISHVMQDGTEQPIAYASKTLSPAEKNYPQIEREALSIIFGLKKFQQYLFGREFVIVTDHRPLIVLFGDKTALPALAAARLQRWSLFLSTFKYKIEYKKGEEHTNVDTLSRFPEVYCEPKVKEIFKLSFLEDMPLTSKEIGRATRNDAILGPISNYVKYGWKECTDEKYKPFVTRRNELSLDKECLIWGMRVIIPSKFREYMLELLHDTHPGITKMKSMARSHVWWPGIDADIEQMSKLCSSCIQHSKFPPVTPMQSWIWPKGPWHRIHVDFAQKGELYFLVIVDSHSKWVEVEKMKSITSQNTIQILRKTFSRYGLPLELVSDNGPQLVSTEFETFLKTNNIKHTLIPAYHPQSNGAAERVVQHFKSALAKMNHDGMDNTTIDHKISRFVLVQHTTQHATTGRAPCELFMGRALRTRLSLVHPSVENDVESKQCEQKHHYDRKHSTQRVIDVNDHVLVKQQRSKDGTWKKGKVCKKLGNNTWEIEMDGTHKLVHTDQIRQDSSNNNTIDNERENVNNSVDITASEQYEPKAKEDVAPQSEQREPKAKEEMAPQKKKDENVTPQVLENDMNRQRRYPTRNRKRPEKLDL